MHVILLGLGVLGAVAGAGLIALNLPVATATLGLLLVVGGVILLVGGATVAGQASVRRELKRLADLVEGKGASLAPPVAGVALPPLVAGAALAPLVAGPALPPLDQGPLRLEPIVPVAKERPAETGDIHPAPPRVETPPRAETPLIAERLSDMAPHADSVAPPVVLDPPHHEPEAPHMDAPPIRVENSAFDAAWSSAPAARHDAAPSGAYAPDVHPEPEPHHATAPQDAPAVFRSGVIDGMAYTLYTDGSIEAELQQGVVRFATVEDLRHYLDDAGGERT